MYKFISFIMSTFDLFHEIIHLSNEFLKLLKVI